ncbi:MAG: UDP-N-acetylmuramate--L-alanine ligase [Actinobacteria bacterium]|nr:UDP-N-acetylmuramate--L-alanine ligase [Actinomycetota bacterium]
MKPARPLSGRTIWFAGIGGAGLSSYAILARAWGADVSGWDRFETPYLRHVRAAGIRVEISQDPAGQPDGAEIVVSTAFRAAVAGKTRAEFLAELVALQASVVVAGTHGKTTTAAMIAFCLDRLGQDPSFLIGGEVAQLGTNARAGTGWLVVEGDESDRTIASLRPRMAVVTNVELDHHTTFASLAELEELFDTWLAQVPQVVRGASLAPTAIDLSVPGEHNRRNAACALAALELMGVEPEGAAAALAEFRGARRRFERRGTARGATVYDDYAHHPTEIAASIEAARSEGAGRVLVAFQPHLFSRTRHLARDLAQSLTRADAVCVTEIYPAREAPLPGVTGKLVVDALVELRPGMPVGWTPSLDDAVAFLTRRVRAGDIVLTLGAGDIDRAAELVLDGLG